MPEQRTGTRIGDKKSAGQVSKVFAKEDCAAAHQKQYERGFEAASTDVPAGASGLGRVLEERRHSPPSTQNLAQPLEQSVTNSAAIKSTFTKRRAPRFIGQELARKRHLAPLRPQFRTDGSAFGANGLDGGPRKALVYEELRSTLLPRVVAVGPRCKRHHPPIYFAEATTWLIRRDIRVPVRADRPASEKASQNAYVGIRASQLGDARGRSLCARERP